MSGLSRRKLFLFARIRRTQGVLPGAQIWTFVILSFLATAAAGAESASGDAKTRWRELNRGVVAAEASTDYATALSKATEALRLAQEAFGDSDPHTLTSMNNLAVVYNDLGRYDDAEPLMVKALQRTKDLFGERSTDTTSCMSTLASVYVHQGRYELAESLYAGALKLLRELKGDRDPETIKSLSNLAFVYEQEGRYKDAENLSRQASSLYRRVLGPLHPDTLSSQANLASVYVEEGLYPQARKLFTVTFRQRQRVLGDRHPDTINSLNSLATLSEDEGHYVEAERLHQQVLQRRREVLGDRHPDTLSAMSNLATDLSHEGRYIDAERLAKDALDLRKSALGSKNPDTVGSMNNLASVFQNEGRFSEAEQLFSQALEIKRQMRGERDPSTLITLNNLASVYRDQGRYKEAEPLASRVYRLRREVLGERHPDTISALNNLATIQDDAGQYEDARAGYEQAFKLQRDTLGETHTDTITSLSNLAYVLDEEGKYKEAEPLAEEAVRLSQRALGTRDPDTIGRMDNLAGVYADEGRYADAEKLLSQAMKVSREVLAPEHPLNIYMHDNHALVHARQKQFREAMAELREVAPQRMSRLGHELYGSVGDNLRHLLVHDESGFQSIVLSVALAEHDTEAVRFAGDILLRWKRVIGAEDAFIARFARNDADAAVRDLATQVLLLRHQLSAQGRALQVDAARETLKLLEAKESQLGQRSRNIGDRLRVARASLDEVAQVLGPGELLLEFRRYRPFLDPQKTSDERWALLILSGGGSEPLLVDAGSIADTDKAIAALLSEKAGKSDDETARKLFDLLFGGVSEHLLAAKRIWIATDGSLALVPFSRLRLPDGRLWGAAKELRFIETGRELLPASKPRAGSGLIAFGGIDYGATTSGDGNAAATPMGDPHSVVVATLQESPDQHRAASRGTRSALGNFPALPETAEEVEYIAGYYGFRRPSEAAIRLEEGKNASTAALRSLLAGTATPRVLHLATHGFFLPNSSELDLPLLKTGVALAGANAGVDSKTGDDGILYAIEAQGLNLEGTELVVLSACETARGSVDYSEGVEGLVQAFRTAGARWVLVSLRKVGDRSAKDFMIDFYDTWLAAAESDPADALQAVQRRWAADQDRERSDPINWAPWLIVGR
jgi:tetratricopeptide (TPR) repeat protein